MVRRSVVLLMLLVLGSALLPAFVPYQFVAVSSSPPDSTLSDGDAYLLGPSSNISTGDTIRFWAPMEDRFQTRRVRDTTPTGYVTTTAANGTADAQSRSVPRTSVTGKAVHVNGYMIRIPLGGPLITSIQLLRPVLLAAALLLLATVVRTERRAATGHRPRQSVVRVRDIARPLLALIFVVTIVITPMGATTYQVAMLAPDQNMDGQATQTVNVQYDKQPYTRLVVTAKAATVQNWTRTTQNVTVTLAPATQTTITIYPYLPILPRAYLERVHRLHPVAAVLSNALLVILPLFVAYRLLLDGSQPVPRVIDRLWRTIRE